MPYPASVIAYAFVKKGIEEGLPVTQMKLQKMVYAAHGFHLALYGEALIQENFQAWKYGPVVRDIYNTYKFYGSHPIADTIWLFFAEDLEKKLGDLDSRAQYVIDFTWKTLKAWNAGQLSNWTHKDGSPWQKVYVEGISEITIPNEDITAYFKKYVGQ